MLILLVRHAVAVNVGAGVRADAQRTLSEEGRTRMAAAARGLRECRVTPTHIFSSPLIRAVQTAELLGEPFGLAERVQPLDELAPGATWENVADQLNDLADDATVALVGHQPDVGRMAVALLGSSGPGAFAFKPGAIALFEPLARTHPIHAKLRWFLTTDQLAAVAMHPA